MKNSIRSLFANRGIEIARGAKAWFTGREQINSYRKPLGECSMEESVTSAGVLLVAAVWR